RATARFELRSVRNSRRTSGEQFAEVRGADGLDQVPLDPGRARELAAGMITVSRQGKQSQVLQLRMLREMPGDLVTAHVRKFEIHEQDLGTNSTARARAVAPVYAVRTSPYPVDCSNEARASAASASSSTI